MENKNLPAYPQSIVINNEGYITCSWDHHSDFMGLSKREQIAALCLQGLLPKTSADGLTQSEFDGLICDAVGLADALLTHLEKTSK